MTVSHHLKDPHSKSLEPDCLPRLANGCFFDIATQPLEGEGRVEGKIVISFVLVTNDGTDLRFSLGI